MERQNKKPITDQNHQFKIENYASDYFYFFHVVGKIPNFNKPSKKFPNRTDAKLFTIKSKLPISAYPGSGDPIS